MSKTEIMKKNSKKSPLSTLRLLSLIGHSRVEEHSKLNAGFIGNCRNRGDLYSNRGCEI
jgi:hypothetical protein